MVNLDFPWDQEYYEGLNFISWWNKKRGKTGWIWSILKSSVVSVAFLLANPAYGQEIGNECVFEISNWGGGWEILPECDLTTPTFFEPNYGYDYYKQLLSTDGHELIDELGFSIFIKNFWPILKHLAENNVLNWSDIVAAMNLYDARGMREENVVEYADIYDNFINSYKNPELNVIAILDKNGYPYHGLI